MPFALETFALSRRFGVRTAVDRVDLQVPERSVYGFLGPNGAGKTTTIKLLLGLLRPDAGRVLVCGLDVARERVQALRQMGALLEAHGLYAHLSGRENLTLTCRLRGLASSEIDRVLEITELQAHQRRRVGEYSLGMRQRLGLARALLGAPRVLILDEPGNGLDPEGMLDLRRFLRELPDRTGATVLVSSHLLSEIEQTASHIGILSHGRLVQQGRLEALKASLCTELLIGTPAAKRAEQIARAHGYEAQLSDSGLSVRIAPGVPIESAAAALNSILCAANIPIHRLQPGQRSLEALYREAGAVATQPTHPAQAA
jgi:ABC-2 type transport system ATP-binding protein